MDDLKQEIEQLKREVALLKQKRIYQSDIVPDVVKTRHMGEANRYVYSGSSLPTGPGVAVGGHSYPIFWAYSERRLYIWDGTQWRGVTLS